MTQNAHPRVTAKLGGGGLWISRYVKALRHLNSRSTSYMVMLDAFIREYESEVEKGCGLRV